MCVCVRERERERGGVKVVLKKIVGKRRREERFVALDTRCRHFPLPLKSYPFVLSPSPFLLIHSTSSPIPFH